MLISGEIQLKKQYGRQATEFEPGITPAELAILFGFYHAMSIAALCARRLWVAFILPKFHFTPKRM